MERDLLDSYMEFNGILINYILNFNSYINK